MQPLVDADRLGTGQIGRDVAHCPQTSHNH